MAMRQRNGLKHCATNREHAGYIADEVTELFSWPVPSNYTVALRVVSDSDRNLHRDEGRVAGA
jgi:hypothetical protein